MQFCEPFDRIEDHLHAVVVSAVTEFAATLDKVFQHEEAVRTAIIIPVRVIAFGRWHFHFMNHEMVEAGFQRMNIDIIERARPVGLHAQMCG